MSQYLVDGERDGWSVQNGGHWKEKSWGKKGKNIFKNMFWGVEVKIQSKSTIPRLNVLTPMQQIQGEIQARYM